jgi:hypothetical protein
MGCPSAGPQLEGQGGARRIALSAPGAQRWIARFGGNPRRRTVDRPVSNIKRAPADASSLLYDCGAGHRGINGPGTPEDAEVDDAGRRRRR